MAGLMSWACSHLLPKCGAVLAAAAAPWREASSGPRRSALRSKRCGPMSMANDPSWFLNLVKSGALPPAVQAAYVGTDCRMLVTAYDDVTPEDQRAAFEGAQTKGSPTTTGGELDAIPDSVASSIEKGA
jgi:hypothetical protein